MREAIRKQVLWKSRDGRYVVIESPFPRGFVRTETRKTLEQAIQFRQSTDAGDIVSRPGVSKKGSYAKTLASLVTEVANKWGPISL